MRPGRAIAAGAACLLALGCRAAPPQLAPPVATPQLASELDAYLASRNPSGVFLFAIGDRVIFHKGYGVLQEGGEPIPADVLFPVGSITKQFTAAAILQLAERRKLSLDDRLDRFFPEAPEDKKAITVQQLLGHNSGLARNAGDVYDRVLPDEARRRIFAAKLDAEPGSRHSYSNSGYILLGQIVERVSGKSLGDYFDQRLFRPAGMTRTGYGSPRFAGEPMPRGYDRPKFDETYSATPLTEPGGLDPRYRYGNGGVLSTAGDLHRWVRALETGKVLSRPWADQMEAPHGVITPDGRFKYGYGWVLQDSKSGPMLWHNGVWYSYYTEIRRFPQYGLIAIGFTNRQQDETFDETFRMAVRRVLDRLQPASASSTGIVPR